MTESMNLQYRQGDVLLMKVDRIPLEAAEQPSDGARVVLAYGEVTGHAHAIEAMTATIFKTAENEYIRVLPGAVLRHEEHAPLTIEPGCYRIIHQREYEPQSWRRVLD